ncbi:MAG: alpha/beta fold hydrolase, partial [Campylobacteraceae bacterium]|nr:alpha/beta fold hydrolase [Campylobacteraceae bacterium]
MKTKIYLLPGLMCNEKLWSKIESDLKIDYELVYLPLPLKDTMAEMIESLEFKEEKINLLAFSLGGYLASSYAIKYPDKINKLFIVSSSLTNLNNIEIRTRENLLSKINTLVFTGLSSKKVQSLIDDKNNKELISLIQNMYKDLGQNVLISQLKSTLKRENLLDGILALD